jgi:hypothetical protein
MKFIALLLAGCAVAWYYFIGGARLDESMVQAFYAKQAHHVLSRDPDGLCGMDASKLAVKDETIVMGRTANNSYNREQACDAQRKAFQTFREIGDKVGGILTIDYEYTIDKIEIPSNRKSALVTVSSTLKMGDTLMQFRTVANEKLTRQWGTVLLLDSDTKSRVRMHLDGMAEPEKYLREQ